VRDQFGFAPARILLAVPNHRRDLEGHALVAYHLVRHYGHEVVFSNIPDLEEAILRHAPDALVLDRIDTRVRIARLAKSFGIRLAMLPTVGFTPDGTEIEARRAGKLVSGEQLLDCCFTWGEQARENLLAHTTLMQVQVHTVGCPRFDCYSEPYLSLIEPREAFLSRLGFAQPRAPLVVWATNTYHSRTRQTSKAIASAVASGVPDAEIRDHLMHERAAFLALAEATAVLARRHAEWNFLIKLHPAETPDPYQEIANRTHNVALATDIRIRDVLYHSDALLANCSTTATEAWMLGKPVFEVVGSSSVAMPPGYLASNHVITRLSDLESLLQAYLRAPGTAVPDAQRRARDEFLRRAYCRIDGRASERCAAHLHQLVSSDGHAIADQARIRAACASAYAAWHAASARRLSNRIKSALALSRETTLRFWRSDFWRFHRRPAEIWEEAVTPQMVQTLFEQFDRAHASRANAGDQTNVVANVSHCG
jgi:surface carbohydrate biosynthesis protein